jgi:predicted aspartyl protease
MQRWTVWAVLLLTNFFSYAPPAHGQSTSQDATAVPFDLVSDFLVVAKGQVGNLNGLKFIVDTGSTWSAIDQKVAEKLRLNCLAGKMMNFNRYIPIEWADVTNFRIGPVTARRTRVMVMNLAKYSEFAKNVDGIIGLDLLSRSQTFAIDYTAKTLYFGPPENSSSRSNPGGFLATIVVQGRPIHLCVDTGSPDILLYENRLRKQLVNLRINGEPITITMGQLKGTKVDLPEVNITGPKQVITVVLIAGPEQSTMPGIDGYLGTASLHPKRIEFDFKNRVMGWD